MLVICSTTSSTGGYACVYQPPGQEVLCSLVVAHPPLQECDLLLEEVMLVFTSHLVRRSCV